MDTRSRGRPTELRTLRDCFGIHQLAFRDVLTEQTRPKSEEYETHTFVLMKTVHLSQRDDVQFHKEIQTRPVGLFIGDDWLVTMSVTDIDLIDPSALFGMKTGRRLGDQGLRSTRI